MKKDDQNRVDFDQQNLERIDLKQHLLTKQQKSQRSKSQKVSASGIKEQEIFDQNKKKIKDNYFNNRNVLKARNIFQAIFFSWIAPFASFGFNFQVTQDNVPVLTQNHKPRIEFQKIYNILKNQNRNHRPGVLLAKTVAKAFKRDYILVFIYTLFFVGLSMCAPIITDAVINFIEQGGQSRQTSKGIILFVGVVLLTFLKLIFQSQVFYKFGIIGFNLSNSLSLLLYEKSLKHPVLCLKKYSVSQIINYSQVDAQRMTYMGFQLSGLLFAPVQVIIGLWLMYSIIGVSFLSGIGVMILTIFLTYLTSKFSVKFNQKVLKAKDGRMKVTQEILNIIRFIKTNAFEKYFWQKLNTKRQIQLKSNKNKLTLQVLQIFIYWLASPLILSMTFATYTWLGYQMTAAKAFTTIMIFRILQYPIRMIPVAISQIIQIWTSIQRIQKFLISEQVQYENIRIGSEKDKFAIKITNGTFAWGKQKEKQKQKDKDKQKDQQEGKKQKQSKKQKKKQNQRIVQSGSILTEEISQKDKSSLIEQNKLQGSILQESILKPQEFKQSEQQKKSQEKIQFVKALKQVNLEIESKSFTMIVGDIGSGKSSLLFAILNQMKPVKNAMVEINGSIAYVPQKPWIMSAKLKDNITFTLPFNRQKFDQAVKFSSMTTDLQLLANGQQTEIGQKGTNLSGGQKARIGLARALYSDRDIYLLDDIISAVDVHVGEFLMKQTILKYLKNKTVIMPTHAVKFAQYADKIIVMKKGKVIKVGSYQEIKDSEQFRQISINLQKKKQQKGKQGQKDELKLVQDLKKIKSAKHQKQKQKDKKNAQKNNEQKVDLTQKIVQQLIMPEDHKRGDVSLEVYKQYVNLNGGLKFLIFVSVCMICWLGFNTYSNIWMQKWCQSPEQGNSYLYIYLVLSITSSVFMLFRAYTLVIGGIKCGSIVHKKITKALLYASLNKFYNRVPLGRIINRLSKDLRQIDEAIGYNVGGFLVSITGLIGTLIICIYASTYLILIPMFVVAFACNKLKNYYMKTQRQCVRLQNITSSPIVSGFLSAINGIQTIRAYNLQQKFLQIQMQKIDQNKRLRITREALESWFCQRLSYITFFVNMTAIGYCMFSSNQNSSLAGLLLTYALTLADDIIDTIFSFTYLEVRMVSVERVSNFMKIQPEEGYKKYTEVWRTKEEGYGKPFNLGQIQFKDVKVRYRENLPYVLQGISLHIKHGQKIGIVGRTGAGKSTIINCLLRILQCSEGQILIDGKNIKDFFLKDLRYNITMIDQQPVLINGTFRQNLNPRKLYNEEQLINIIKQCNLLQVVQEKGGLDSKITNDSLSVGEKQLLCICRAFLKKSKIVLVDQATANIDQKNDKLIQDVISTKFKDSTVLTIAHRLSTLMNSDKILVLGQGKVLQWGSPQQLLNKQNGVYKEMCQKGNITSQYLS